LVGGVGTGALPLQNPFFGENETALTPSPSQEGNWI